MIYERETMMLQGNRASVSITTPRIRPVADIARDGLAYDALGYHALALWLACFLQAYEATEARPIAIRAPWGLWNVWRGDTLLHVATTSEAAEAWIAAHG